MNRAPRYLIPLLSLFAVVATVRAIEAATTLTGQVTIPSPTMIQPGPILSGQGLRIGESIITSFDPRVSGLSRPVGSVVYTRDGTLGYAKTGTGSTSWAPFPSGDTTTLSTDPAVIEANRIGALGLGLTQCRRINPLGAIPIGTTTAPTTNDGAIEGGGRKSTTNPDYYGPSIYQNVLTGVGAISFRAILKGPSVNRAEVGLINAAGLHVVVMLTLSTVDATHYVLETIGGAGTVNAASATLADNAIHWFRLAWTASTFTMYIDNVATTATTNKANVSTEPLYPMDFSVVAGDVTVTDIVYCFVSP